ncbi:MAG: DUF5995 family protein [Terracidiphilus sp.]
MFPYDSTLVSTVATAPESVPDVVRMLENIGSVCADTDGLKWFNWLYLEVTEAVQARVNYGKGAIAQVGGGDAEPDGFADPAWLAALDVHFAGFYFAAIQAALSTNTAPGCWQAVFNARNQQAVARIQFALAGMNAHINHDLPLAIVALCQSTGIEPQHGTAQYNDFTALNATLDSLIDVAKQELNVRLAGDALPGVSGLEDTLAAWSMSAARETAWNNAELLWHLKDAPPVSAKFVDSLDGLTSVAGKTLLVPVP